MPSAGSAGAFTADGTGAEHEGRDASGVWQGVKRSRRATCGRIRGARVLAFRKRSAYVPGPFRVARRRAALARRMSPEPSTASLALYERRFSAADRRAKDALWRVLCEDFFQRWVPGRCSAGRPRRRAVRVRQSHPCPREMGDRHGSRAAAARGAGRADPLRSGARSRLARRGERRRRLRQQRVRALRDQGRHRHRRCARFTACCVPGDASSCSDRTSATPRGCTGTSSTITCRSATGRWPRRSRPNGFTLEHVRARFLPYTIKSRFPRWPVLVRCIFAARRCT